jgi:hypothetical protein
VIKPRLAALAVPTKAKAIAISARRGLERIQALRDERMRGFGDVMRQRDGGPLYAIQRHIKQGSEGKQITRPL